VIETALHELRKALRKKKGKDEYASVGIIDSASVRMSSISGHQRGVDGNKKIKGSKRDIIVDTMGLIICLSVHAANIHDRKGAKKVFEELYQIRHDNSKDNIQEKFNEEVDNELLNFINTKLEFYNKLTEDKVNHMFKSLWFNDLYDQKVRKGEKGKVNDEVKRLEVLPKLKERFNDWVNLSITSLKVCQDAYVVFVEINFENSLKPVRTDLDFISAEEENFESLLFEPSKDIVDNTKEFVELDQYSLYMCLNNLFTNEAEEIIKKDVNS